MDIIEIPGFTRVLGKPADWDEAAQGPCVGLPILDTFTDKGVPVMLSAWKPTEREIELILMGRYVILQIVGHGHPPVAVWTPEP